MRLNYVQVSNQRCRRADLPNLETVSRDMASNLAVSGHVRNKGFRREKVEHSATDGLNHPRGAVSRRTLRRMAQLNLGDVIPLHLATVTFPDAYRC
jgi:hypothetical protein